MNPPKAIHATGKIFSSPKKIACAKACSSHCCEVNRLFKLAHDSSTFLTFFLEGILSSKSLMKS